MRALVLFLMAAFLGVGSGRGLAVEPVPAAKGQSFKWCVANSAFQVEGSPADSDWRVWTRLPHKIEDGSNADRVFDFWNQPEVEFDLAQTLGVNTFRLSVAWDRIEPSPGVWDELALERYKQMMISLHARGIDPLVTLHHFALPMWLVRRGGVLAPEFPSLFARYVEKVVQKLGFGPARVTSWITFNEPAVWVKSSYLDGDWPPGVKGGSSEAVQALAQIGRAHFAAVQVIRRLNASSNEEAPFQIGFAKHWRDFQPKSGSRMDALATSLTERIFNRQITEMFAHGQVSLWMPGSGWVHEQLRLPDGMKPLDFIGINYYGRTLVSFKTESPFIVTEEGPGPKSDIGWEVYAPGLRKVLREAYKSYHLPLLITENGLADERDRLRSQFIHDHLQVVREEIQKGLPVIGYCHWTLTDNFEWSRGLRPKFGLVSYDPQSLKRTPRASFFEYQQEIRNSSHLGR